MFFFKIIFYILLIVLILYLIFLAAITFGSPETKSRISSFLMNWIEKIDKEIESLEEVIDSTPVLKGLCIYIKSKNENDYIYISLERKRDYVKLARVSNLQKFPKTRIPFKTFDAIAEKLLQVDFSKLDEEENYFKGRKENSVYTVIETTANFVNATYTFTKNEDDIQPEHKTYKEFLDNITALFDANINNYLA